jgi:hypothetical protein
MRSKRDATRVAPSPFKVAVTSGSGFNRDGAADLRASAARWAEGAYLWSLTTAACNAF